MVSNNKIYLILLLCCITPKLAESSELIQYGEDGLDLKDIDHNVVDPDGDQKANQQAVVDPVVVDPVSAEVGATYINFNFMHAFFASLSVIIVSEIGDKTFFIAAIMAMRHPRTIVFVGAIGALGLMTVLSVFLGYATTVIPRKYTFYISTALFAIFGLKMLKEGWEMDPNEGQEEMEEVQQELKLKEAELEAEQKGVADLESGGHTAAVKSKIQRSRVYRMFAKLCSPILIQSFTMTFLAEWGDRSQLTTIILGSREDPVGVTIGGTLGHALCTGLAVIGGRLIAQKISVRTVTLIGGVVFLLFALSALVLEVEGEIG